MVFAMSCCYRVNCILVTRLLQPCVFYMGKERICGGKKLVTM